MDDDADDDNVLFTPVEKNLADHHRLLLTKLETISETPYGRLLVMMPPGSAKSTYGSVVFPSRYLGRKPNRRLILASYGDDLARKMGRRTRAIIKQPRYRGIWNCELAADSSAAQEFALTNGSEYMAAGRISGITGNRAHGLIIDDPIKGREAAESQVQRDKIWDAIHDDGLSRLLPGGWVVMIMCMTGSTLVLMADGTERALRDIRPRDKIATYDCGKLSTSTVERWANQGPDDVFRIRTANGFTTHANARHPFLVERNRKRQWIRLKNLQIGDRMVRLPTEATPGSNASKTDATRQLNASCDARLITANGEGLPESLLPLSSTKVSAERPELSTVTVLPRSSIGLLSKLKAACARSARSLLRAMSGRIGAASFASTTITRPAAFADCSATTATWPSGMADLRKCLRQPQDTCEFTADEIISIESVGREDVFDIQVARTENFIADGFVSHNTRWNEDDPAGRILPEGWKGESGTFIGRTDGLEWHVLCLQALCETDTDPLGRKRGEYLWPEWFDQKHWSQFKNSVRTWNSLYQQRPAPLEGDFFKPAMMPVIDAMPAGAIKFVRGWDFAATHDDGDWTVGAKIGVMPDGRWLVADIVRLQGSPDEVVAALKNTAALDGKSVTQDIPQDPGQAGKSQVAFMAKQLAGYTVSTSTESGDKVTRAEPLASQVNVGNVVMLRGEWNKGLVSEMRAFPNGGAKDDQVDACSRSFNAKRIAAAKVTELRI